MIVVAMLLAGLERITTPWRSFEATAYSHGCTATLNGVEPKTPQRTASGREAVPNWSVAASKEFDFGAVLEVSYGGVVDVRVVHDRGRKITKGKLDFFVEDCERAKVWGRRRVWVREIQVPLGMIDLRVARERE